MPTPSRPISLNGTAGPKSALELAIESQVPMRPIPLRIFQGLALLGAGLLLMRAARRETIHDSRPLIPENEVLSAREVFPQLRSNDRTTLLENGVRTDVEAGSTLVEEQQSWLRCMREVSSDAAVRACLRADFQRNPPTASSIGLWVCDSTESVGEHALVVEEALTLLDGWAALSFLDDFQRTCDVYKTQDFLRARVRAVSSRRPDWLSGLGAALTPNFVFDATRGVALVQVLRVLAEGLDDGWATLLVEEGGRGGFGGSVEQIDQAAATAFVLARHPERALEYARSILASSSAPAGAALGNTLIHFLCAATGECWPNGDAGPALGLAMCVLNDPRFADEAASQFLAEFGRQAPDVWPSGAWELLVTRARSIRARR